VERTFAAITDNEKIRILVVGDEEEIVPEPLALPEEDIDPVFVTTLDTIGKS